MGRGGGRVDKCYKLSNRGGCGGVWWGVVDGSTPNDRVPWYQLWVVEETCKTGK